MPARVTLKVTEGDLAGKEFTYEETTTCIIGRGPNCEPRLPNDKNHRTISRHHCLLDINPPDARIRDFGSLNGTYVNDNRIGSRERSMSAEEAANAVFPEHDLKHGDRIKLGKTIFQVDIFEPAVCGGCAAEIPEDQKDAAKIGDNVYQCRACREKAQKENQPPPDKNQPKKCVFCGKDVSAEVGNRVGEFACSACKKDPLQIIRHLMGLAAQGSKDLPAIQGYEIVRELGRGGMGAVYLAQHKVNGEQVALKVMLPEVAVDKRAENLFLREARVTKGLKHPNIVQLMDSGCSEGTFFFTLEFCDGGSVDKLMERRGGVLPLDEALEITIQALEGLAYAHNAKITTKTEKGKLIQKKGLVHRDLKPPNIFLSGSGSSRLAKVADLGLAKAFRSAGLSGLTATGTAAGSPWFMPKQQVLQFKYSKPEVDVWAMAASLYFMVTGFFPRDFPKGRDPWLVVLQDPVIPIQHRLPSIPKRLADVINEALRDEPDIGFKKADKLKKALEKAQ